MDKLEFCKEHYFFEINRKNQLTSSLALPIGLLTILGGVISYYLKYFVFSGAVIPVLYSALIVVALFFLARTVYYLIRSYHNFTYGYIATPDKLLEYHNQLVVYYTKNENNPAKAEEVFKEYIKNQYSMYASQNTWNNDSKSEYLHEANSNLIYSLILVLLCSIPYLFITNGNSDTVQKIEIIGIDKILNKVK